MHLTAHYLERRGDSLVPLRPKLGLNTNYFMKACPGENWIVLNPGQCSKLLPQIDFQPGTRWEIAPDVAALLFRNMYPPTEDNDLGRNRIDLQTLQATVVARNSGDGPRPPGRDPAHEAPLRPGVRDDKKFVDAAVTGFFDFDVNRSSIRRLQLISTQPTYGKSPFGVARSFAALTILPESPRFWPHGFPAACKEFAMLTFSGAKQRFCDGISRGNPPRRRPWGRRLDSGRLVGPAGRRAPPRAPARRKASSWCG